MAKKYDYSYVYNYFKKHGCELLEDSYINGKTKMSYRCSCGTIATTSFFLFKRGRRCKQCAIEKLKLTQEEVDILFLSEGWINNSVYKNNYQRLNVICNNGHKTKTCVLHFKKGVRCIYCTSIKNSGENHYKWNPNREEVLLNKKLRILRSYRWICENMKSDVNYNNYKKFNSKYVVDHILPVKLFVKLTLHFNLNKKKIKQIVNKRENLQILSKKDNSNKSAKGNIFQVAQYLMLNGIRLT